MFYYRFTLSCRSKCQILPSLIGCDINICKMNLNYFMFYIYCNCVHCTFLCEWEYMCILGHGGDVGRPKLNQFNL